MRRFFLLLTLLLVSCGGQTPATPTSAPAPSAPPAATSAPEAPPTSPPALPPAPTPTIEVAATATPEPESDAAPTQEPAIALTPVPFGRAIQVQQPVLQGEDISAVQRRLLALGYTQLGTADGLFGPQSEVAVRAFQTRNGLDVDGIVGPSTWERLFGPSPLAAEGAGPLVPIVDAADSWLIGAARDGRWVWAIDTVGLIADGQAYTLYQPDGSVAALTGSQPGSLGIPCEDTQVVSLSPSPQQGIAVGAGLNARPVSFSDGDMQSTALTALVERHLVAKGISSPNVQIVRVLEADLDGDGSPEQVVAATRMKMTESGGPSPDADAGDYSFVAVAPESGDLVILTEQYHPQAAEFSAPEEHQLVDLLDLNGDGTLEVVVSSRYYEGAAITIFTYQGGKAQDTLITGCGV